MGEVWVRAFMDRSPHIPYLIILTGLLLFFAGMVVDLGQHGKDFLVKEFQEAPLAHGLPLAGILVVIIGTVLGWRRAGKQ
jgi:hypothetical protein